MPRPTATSPLFSSSSLSKKRTVSVAGEFIKTSSSPLRDRKRKLSSSSIEETESKATTMVMSMEQQQSSKAVFESRREVIKAVGISKEYELEADHPFYAYGTSGFRMLASKMEPIAFRCGFFAAYLSRHVYEGRVVGVMLTASHNPVQDNGIKFVAPDGHVLDMEYESLAESFANATDPRQCLLAADGSSKIPSKDCRVAFGRDTRPSGTTLQLAAVQGALYFDQDVETGVKLYDVGVVTTPEMHVAVPLLNSNDQLVSDLTQSQMEEKYLTAMAEAFVAAVGESNDNSRKITTVVVDCANGVGAGKVKRLNFILQKLSSGIELVAVNDGTGAKDILNENCGADYVKTKSAPPANIMECCLRQSSSCVHFPNKDESFVSKRPRNYTDIYKGKLTDNEENCDDDEDDVSDSSSEISVQQEESMLINARHFCSLDGDADRLVYFVPCSPFVLLDGDRIAVLATACIRRLLEKCGLSTNSSDGAVDLAVVQTAYANGASSDYLRNSQVKVEPFFARTGVKHLHAEALCHDISVYFEANGHGTVLCNDATRSKLRQLAETGDESSSLAAKQLLALMDLANPLVGDALADLLLVEAMLIIDGLNMQDWSQMYTDRPSCLLKVSVPDRACFETTDADRRLLQPIHLQLDIDQLVRNVADARIFVRPSGTEDVVRVFAEAVHQQDADRLALSAVELVKKHCGA